MNGIERPIPHRCLAFTDEGPWCPNIAVIGRSFCEQCLCNRALSKPSVSPEQAEEKK